MERTPEEGPTRVRTLVPGEPGYPASLGAGGRAPALRVRGEIPRGRGVAIVGARDASEEACGFAFALAFELARAGVVVWSGGARGIDAAAHAGALEAGGATVAALGGGLSRLYPPENVELFGRIARQGALVSHLPDEAPPLRPGFLERNRVLAAAADALVVVEAGLKSGARRAAAAARRLGRPLGVVPHSPWSVRGAGCAAELARGDAAAIASAGDALRLLGLSEARRRLAGAEAPERAGERGRSGKGPGALSERLPLRPAELPPDAAAGHPLASAPPLAAPPDALNLSGLERAAAPAGGPGGLAPLAREGAHATHATRATRATYEALASLEIERGAAHVDAICERTGLPFPEVSGALLTLTLDAVVVEGPAGHYRRR